MTLQFGSFLLNPDVGVMSGLRFFAASGGE